MPIITQLPALPTYRKSGRPKEAFNRYRKSTVPEQGWTQETFQTRRGRYLLRDILAVRRLAIRENAGKLSRSLLSMFEDEASMVFGRFVSKLQLTRGKTIGSDLMSVVLNLQVPDNAVALWEAALDEVFAEGQVQGRILKVFRPAYQSTLDHVTRKTNVLITKPERTVRPSRRPQRVTTIETEDVPDTSQQISKERFTRAITASADNLVNKVTRISTTTRNRMRRFFDRKLIAGTPIGQVLEDFREEFDFIAKNRVTTIVRNELSLAANEAQLLSFENHPTLTHCSVVGCQAIEESSPTYQGFHTCNIQNVPVYDLRYVEFHINHTGSWVPSGFKYADGTVPRLRLGNTEGIGDYDDPNALRHTNPARVGMDRVVRPA